MNYYFFLHIYKYIIFMRIYILKRKVLEVLYDMCIITEVLLFLNNNMHQEQFQFGKLFLLYIHIMATIMFYVKEKKFHVNIIKLITFLM